MEEGLTLGDKWFNEAFGDQALRVYEDVIVPLVLKKKGETFIAVTKESDKEIFDAIGACNFSTLARICQENCIEIHYRTEIKGWFADSTKAFILTPITYRYRSYHSRKPECFSPRTNRGDLSSFTFLKE